MHAIATLFPAAADTPVAVTSIDTPLGAMHVASLPAGICAAVFDDRREALEPRLRRMFGPFLAVASGDPLDVAPRLRAYFDGSLDALRDVPQAVAATPMQRRVWALVSALGAGTLTTYVALADRLGMPRAQRAVGVCLASNPIPPFIPCHRVVAASGALASHPGGAVRKQWLLRHEGALDVADLTAARVRRIAALDPRDTVELVALPRVVGY
jgi:methylated-DNA-[protein]-cysteine S-methyltransferase